VSQIIKEEDEKLKEWVKKLNEPSNLQAFNTERIQTMIKKIVWFSFYLV